MARSLVLARVGRRSLHGLWVDPRTPRDWDLVLCPFEDIPPQDAVDCSVTDVIPGPKWSGIRDLLGSWDGWREYDQIWLPDDDILASQDTISRMFSVADAVGLELFAPALQEGSYFAHFSTMANRRFFGRWTGFVEIMVPAFSTATLERLLPTLELSDTGWGWGLDSLWPKLLGYENVGIIDGTPVLHTRPVGVMRDPELRRRVMEESDRILSDGACEQVHATFGAFGPDLERLELSPDALLAELVAGWQHLIDRDPRLLGWIAEFQRGQFPPVDYPAEGTPEGGGAAPAPPRVAIGERPGESP